jgi:hypothetical protein
MLEEQDGDNTCSISGTDLAEIISGLIEEN